MNLFSEMIKKGIAPARHHAWGKSVPATVDQIPVKYNNVWGAASDTHMDISETGAGYIITGSIIRDPRVWDTFTKLTTWRCVDLPQSLEDFLEENNLRGTYDHLNGDIIYRVVVAEEKQ